jgi:hypothetical protein
MTQVGADVYLKLTTYETLVFRDTDAGNCVSDDFQLPGALPISGAAVQREARNPSMARP